MANKRSKRNENAIPLRDLLFHCLSRWYWFIISLTVTLGLAALYILSTPPAYVRYTEILIKENSNGGKGGDGLNNFASAQSTANAETEMLALRSPGIMKEVIDSLELGVEYKIEGRFHDAVMYKSSPIAVSTLELYENDNATFWAELNKNKTLKLHSFTKNGEELDGEVDLKIGDTIATPVGKLHVAATEHYNRFAGERVHVNRKGRNSVINEFCSRVKTEFVNEESSIVRLSIKDISNNRADDILRAITDIYNRQWIERNNGNIVKISEFIRQRIDSLQVELSLLDKEIAAFKSENKLTATKIEDLNSEVNKIDNSRLIELNSQFELTKFVKKIVVENAGNKNILPANTGAEIPGIEELIASYNQEIIKRDRYIENSSEANPLVADCNDKLNAMYKSINDAVDSHLENIRRSIALEEQKGTTKKVEFSKNTEQIKDALTTGKHYGHDWVDLGLPSGLKWATCNVGASSPSDYGDYYAWGEISTKSSYDENNSTTYGKKIGDIAGNPTYDVVRAKWHGSWRLPTEKEFQELLDNCTWEWTTQDGHNGCKVTSMKNGNSIFLPAAGWRGGTSSGSLGSGGGYWSATPDESGTSYAYGLYFHEYDRSTYCYYRYYGRSVRPVFQNN